MKHKKIVFIILAIVSIGICGAVSAYTLLFNRPLNITEPTFLYIDENDNIDSVYTKLEKKFHASSLFGFRILTHYSKYHKNIHTGAYLFSDNERTWDIFHRLRTGHQTPVTLTIPSVRTVGQLLKTVSRQLMLDSASIAKLLNDSAYCSNLGYNHYTIPASSLKAGIRFLPSRCLIRSPFSLFSQCFTPVSGSDTMKVFTARSPLCSSKREVAPCGKNIGTIAFIAGSGSALQPRPGRTSAGAQRSERKSSPTTDRFFCCWTKRAG